MSAERPVVVRVDPVRCVSSAMCVHIAPEKFALGPDGKSRVLNPETVGEDLYRRVWEAAFNCPVSAIAVEDAETGDRLFPEEP
ncbi:MAG: ferredoxin [Clostridia bacterium]|nr:ferredoxin [Clostridia bacterium]